MTKAPWKSDDSLGETFFGNNKRSIQKSKIPELKRLKIVSYIIFLSKNKAIFRWLPYLRVLFMGIFKDFTAID